MKKEKTILKTFLAPCSALITLCLFIFCLFTFNLSHADIKWVQPPNMGPGICSQCHAHEDEKGDWESIHPAGPNVADDFQCNDPDPVIGICWWGSYLDEEPVVPGMKWFKISFHLTGGCDPGQLLGYQVLEASETFYGTTGDGEDIYYYCIADDVFFQQTPDNMYWLDIAYCTDCNGQRLWGWHESSIQNLCPAVTSLPPYNQEDPQEGPWYPLDMFGTQNPIDMAFALYTQPNVLAGVDLWETRPGDATHEFGGGVECPPIPADFFEPGSDPFDGIIYFKGQPLETTPADILGSTDTIVKRSDDAVLPQCPSSDTVPIEIVALNLVSTEPINVTYNGGQNPELWDVQMCLSSAAQDSGNMTINKDCDYGGTFTAELPVTPKFTFTKVGDPFELRVLDYGIEGISATPYDITDGHWLYSDHGSFVITSPGGLVVDHDCEGTSDVAVGPSSNFYPGLQATPCNSCPGSTPTYSMVKTLWQSPDCGLHGVYPPQSPCLADIDRSNVVDLDDLGIMKEEFFRSGCDPDPYSPPYTEPCCKADIDGSTVVDLDDLGIMKEEFFRSGCPLNWPPPCLP